METEVAKKRKIQVTAEVRTALIEEFDLGNEQTVYNALNFVSDSPSARMIRKRALEMGGVLWEAACCNECHWKEYPACEKGIPCCRCTEECNSRQVCLKGQRG